MKVSTLTALALTFVSAACDSTPDADFVKTATEKDAAAADAYSLLESARPHEASYAQHPIADRRRYAENVSGTYRSNYEQLLTQLDGDKQIVHGSALFRDCRAAFGDANAYALGAADVAAKRDETVAALKSCHEASQKEGNAGAMILLRFAAAGVVVIGTKTAGQGNADAGLQIWRQGEQMAPKLRSGGPVSAPTAG